MTELSSVGGSEIKFSFSENHRERTIAEKLLSAENVRTKNKKVRSKERDVLRVDFFPFFISTNAYDNGIRKKQKIC